MKLSFLFVAFLFSSLTAQAISVQLLETQKGAAKIENIPIATGATLKDGAKLQFVGAGLRSKKVLFVNVKVYVAQLFVGDLSKFKKAPGETLSSVASALPIAIQLHFLRDVEAEKVQSSFVEALKANKADLKKPEMQTFLEAVKNGGSAKEGKSLTIYGTKNADGTETLTYEDPYLNATVINGSAGFIKDVFAIWLGHPSDEGVAKLKAQILK